MLEDVSDTHLSEPGPGPWRWPFLTHARPPLRLPGRPRPVEDVAARIQAAFGLSPRLARVAVAAALLLCGVVVAFATRSGTTVLILAGSLALVGVVMSARWPLLPLFGLALLIPIEEAVVIGGLGSLSRYAELAFVFAYGLPRLGRLRASAMPPAGWVFVAWAVLSATWALDPAVTLDQLPTLVLTFVMAVLVASLVAERPAIVRPLLWAYSASASVTAVLGIYEFAQGGEAGRVAALPGQDPAHYAALLLPALVFAMYQLLRGATIIPAAAVTLICGVGVIVSGTRGAWLGLAVVLALLIVPRLTPVRRLAVGLVLALLVTVGLQVPGVATFISERADTAVSSGGAGRTDIWYAGLLIFESAPITGVGLDNFPVAHTPELVRASDVKAYLAPWRTANRAPHSIVFGTLGELGIVGMILLVLFLAPLVLRTGWGPDAAAIQAALVSLATMALFLDLLNRKHVWLLIGIACGLAYLHRRSTASVTAARRGRLRSALARQGRELFPPHADRGSVVPATHASGLR
jgi:O-antigen ligase